MNTRPINDSDSMKIDIHGAIDVIGSRQVMGWVVDLNNPESTMDVEVVRNGKVIERTIANVHRPDLVNIANKSGNHGFIVNLGVPLEEGLEFTIRAFAFTEKGAVELPRLDPAALAGGHTARILQWSYNEINSLRAEISEIKNILSKINSKDYSKFDPKVITILDTIFHRVSMIQAQSENIIHHLDIKENSNSDNSAFRSARIIITISIVQVIIISLLLYKQLSS